MEYNFETPSPVDLYLELDRGQVSVTAGATGQSSIRVEGDQPERLQVAQEGDHLRAVVERRSLFDFAPSLQVWVTVPAESRVVVKTGSADVAISGLLAEAVVASGSGAVEVADVSGLTRVRQFCQDDAHCFVAEDQIGEEVERLLKLVHQVYGDLGLDYSLTLATRPPDFLGEAATWDHAEDSLKKALEAAGLAE